MVQNVLLKYGDTSTISGETIQQGKILIDTEKAEISIDKDGMTRLPLTSTVDSALSTTSTNPVQNTIVTTSLNQKVEKTDVVNDLASAVEVTATDVPVGCGAIKELNESLPIYNPVTDSLDIYSDGVIVGSIPCEFQTLYLYKDGVVNTSAIGGFTPYAYSAYGDHHETMNSLSIEYNAASMRVSAPAVSSGYNHVGTMFTNLPVNFDGKTSLCIDFDYLSIPSGDAESYIRVGVTSYIADNYAVLASVKRTASTTTPSTLVIPVSNITSNCYVFVELLGWDKAAVPYIDISKIYFQ